MKVRVGLWLWLRLKLRVRLRVMKSSKESKIFFPFQYIPLMAEGLVLFSEANSSTFKLKRGIKYYFHLTLLAAAVVTVTIGIVIEYQNKDRFHGKHFMSKHAKLGMYQHYRYANVTD